MLLRSKLGVFLVDAYSGTLEAPSNHRFFEQAEHFVQTKRGDMIVAASDKHCVVLDIKNGKKLFEGDFTFIYYVALSPC